MVRFLSLRNIKLINVKFIPFIASSPTDVSAEDCSSSSQLTGLLLLLHLALRLLVLLEHSLNQGAQIRTFINGFQGMTSKWERLRESSGLVQTDLDFIIK